MGATRTVIQQPPQAGTKQLVINLVGTDPLTVSFSTPTVMRVPETKESNVLLALHEARWDLVTALGILSSDV